MTDPNTIRKLLDKGLTYFGLGQVDQAKEIWNQVLELEPGNQQARKYLEFVQNNWEPPKDVENELVQSNQPDIPQESIDCPTEQQPETIIGSSSLPSYPSIDKPQQLESVSQDSIFDNNPAVEKLINQPAQSETVKDHIDETDSPLDEEADNHLVEIEVDLDVQEVDVQEVDVQEVDVQDVDVQDVDVQDVDYQQTSEAILGLVADTLDCVQPVACDLDFDESRKVPENEADAWLKHAKDHLEMDDFTNALELSEKVLLEDENHFEALSIKREAEDSLLSLLSSKLGDLERIPVVGMMDEEIIWLNLDHQAGFILSLVDGQMTLDEIISVSNLKQLDIMRILVQLLQENIIKLG